MLTEAEVLWEKYEKQKDLLDQSSKIKSKVVRNLAQVKAYVLYCFIERIPVNVYSNY